MANRLPCLAAAADIWAAKPKANPSSVRELKSLPHECIGSLCALYHSACTDDNYSSYRRCGSLSLGTPWERNIRKRLQCHDFSLLINFRGNHKLFDCLGARVQSSCSVVDLG